jgi:hypothetical protein
MDYLDLGGDLASFVYIRVKYETKWWVCFALYLKSMGFNGRLVGFDFLPCTSYTVLYEI